MGVVCVSESMYEGVIWYRHFGFERNAGKDRRATVPEVERVVPLDLTIAYNMQRQAEFSRNAICLLVLPPRATEYQRLCIAIKGVDLLPELDFSQPLGPVPFSLPPCTSSPQAVADDEANLDGFEASNAAEDLLLYLM